MSEETQRFCPFCNETFLNVTKIKHHLLDHFGKEFPQKSAKEFITQNQVKLEPFEPICDLEVDQKTDINVKSEVEHSSKSTKYFQTFQNYLISFILQDILV